MYNLKLISLIFWVFLQVGYKPFTFFFNSNNVPYPGHYEIPSTCTKQGFTRSRPRERQGSSNRLSLIILDLDRYQNKTYQHGTWKIEQDNTQQIDGNIFEKCFPAYYSVNLSYY